LKRKSVSDSDRNTKWGGGGRTVENCCNAKKPLGSERLLKCGGKKMLERESVEPRILKPPTGGKNLKRFGKKKKIESVLVQRRG